MQQKFSSLKKMTSTVCITAVIFLSMVASPAEAIAAPNPVRRVINMLQMMQKKVEMEGTKTHLMFDKYMCFCKTGLSKLNTDIENGKDTVPQLEGSIKEQSAQKGALQNDITDGKADFAEAMKTLGEATSLRTKENKEFVDEDGRMKTDIKALHMAIKAISRGGAFLQTDLLASVRKLVATNVDISTSDRDVVSSFLSQSESTASEDLSEGSPSEINGILKQMAETMSKDHVQMNADEKNGVKQYESVKSAKELQTSTLQKEISTKTERAGKVGLQLVEDKAKLDDTKKALKSNEKLQAGLSKQCKAREMEFGVEAKTRSEELLAIQDTIKILNDDMAHKLFKKTMPVPVSFLQVQVSPKALRGRALQSLKGSSDPRVNFVALALRSRKTSFTKVLQMVDGMIVLLNKEQKDDADKKQYCKSEIDKNTDAKKELDNDISDLNKAMEQATQKAKQIRADIRTKSESIKSLDKQVGDATKQRKEEHGDYMENLQANNAAKEILSVAKVRLGKFYDKEGQKAQNLLQVRKAQPAKQVVGKALKIKAMKHSAVSTISESRHVLSDDGKASLESLFDEGALSFAQVDMQTQAQSMEYSRVAADGKKVVALIGSIIGDINKDVTEMTKDEKEAQFEYKQILKDSAEKRAAEAKSVSELEGSKAESEAEMHKMKLSTKSKMRESAGKATYLKDLHKQCDWLMKHFKTRRSARAGEIDALKKARAVLSGK